MSSDRDVKINHIYRHWKGDEYEVLGEFRILDDFEEGETLKTSYGQTITTTALIPGNEAVVYQSSDKKIFLREKNNFLEILGDKEEGTMYYRFEAIAQC